MTNWEGWEDDLEVPVTKRIDPTVRNALKRFKDAIIELRTAVETIWHELDERDETNGGWFKWH